MTYFTADKRPLLNFISDALTAGGFTETNSNIVAEHLVDAEMKGVPSHGVNRLGLYIGEAKEGIIDPTKVTRTALENAVSVAGTMLITECTIVDDPKEKAIWRLIIVP